MTDGVVNAITDTYETFLLLIQAYMKCQTINEAKMMIYNTVKKPTYQYDKTKHDEHFHELIDFMEWLHDDADYDEDWKKISVKMYENFWKDDMVALMESKKSV